MARAKMPVSVDGIEFDALIDEQRQLDAEIPQYTTEEGFQISDAIIVDAETVSMTLFVTDTPVTWLARHGNSHAADVCSRLEALYFAKEPVTIKTTDATYTMMGIQSITFQKSFEIGYSKEIPITFKKIRKTYTRTISGIGSFLPSGGTTGAMAGTANTSPENTAAPSSTAYNLINGLIGGTLPDVSTGSSTSAYASPGFDGGGKMGGISANNLKSFYEVVN